MLFKKVFLINLERRQDRLAQMLDRFAQIGILGNVPLEIVRAFDWKQIDDEFLKEKNVSPWPEWRDPWFGRTINKGDIGCSMSHNSVWEKIIDQNLEGALVVEDDAQFNPGLLSYCEKIEKELSNFDYDFLYLGRKPMDPKHESEVSENLIVPWHSYWTVGYYITQKGAKKLYETNFMQNIIPIDEYIPYMYGKGTASIFEKFDYNSNLNALAVKDDVILPAPDAFMDSETEKSEPLSKSKNMKVFGKNVHVLTVATEENDGLSLLLRSAKKYGIKVDVLGLDEKWDSGNKPRLDYPGGGQKINILKNKLKTIPDEDVVIFVDAYDVIFNADLHEIIAKFDMLKAKMLFSAETVCWPDKNLESEYPKTVIPYKFLNSGSFIGFAANIKNLIADPIKNTDDDQLYYSKRFLNYINSDPTEEEMLKRSLEMALDYECSIFQTSLQKKDTIRIDGKRNRCFNIANRNLPCIIHGNGDVLNKMSLQKAANHLVDFRNHYGYCKIDSKDYRKEDLPVIFLNANLDRGHANTIIARLFNIDYPKDKIILHFNLKEGFEFKLSGKLLQSSMEYKEFSMTEHNPYFRDMNKGALKVSENFDFDYMFTIDENCVIENNNILIDLLNLNKNIVSPLFKEKDSDYSNVWPLSKGELLGMRGSLELLDYYNIVERRVSGCWMVPFISKSYLVKKELIPKIKDFYEKNQDNEIMESLDPSLPKDSIGFCSNLIENGIFLHLDNQKIHGTLV